ncbi:putative glucan endo-1 [Forsythia ovata]|uniref:Glucan endo-1 n=1 Tax=Forsythia ovata TaxID=205694 RepID=A0ABD1P4N4_9LAMI
MQNPDAAINAANSPIPVSTVVPMQVMGTSFPPSNGKFPDETAATMQGIAGFLAAKKPLFYSMHIHSLHVPEIPVTYRWTMHFFVGKPAGKLEMFLSRIGIWGKLDLGQFGLKWP